MSTEGVFLNCTWQTLLSVNKSACFWHVVRSHISVCLFCLLETTSLNEFMISLPGSECWHFKISSSFLGEMFWPPRFWYLDESRRDSQQVFDCQDFEISPRSYLKSCWDSQWGFGRRDFEISVRISASFWLPRSRDLAKISARISTRFWDLSEFLATEILRSRQDLGENLNEILRSRWESQRIFGRQDFEILARSRWDLGNLGGQKPAEISPRSRSKFCRGSPWPFRVKVRHAPNLRIPNLITETKTGPSSPYGPEADN